jgi:hypothetical protein
MILNCQNDPRYEIERTCNASRPVRAALLSEMKDNAFAVLVPEKLTIRSEA